MEGYNGKNGWTIEHKDLDASLDKNDATAIYRKLEEEIIPTYYLYHSSLDDFGKNLDTKEIK